MVEICRIISYITYVIRMGGTTMNDLVILHLSDLHIDDKGRSFSKLHLALLNDIKAQISFVPDNRLVVVVTGDIINKGEHNALTNAKKFFQRLKEITIKKLKAIYVIPGNHDKKRTSINRFLVPAYRGLSSDSISTLFDEKFAEKIWPLHSETYEESGYAELIDYIYNELFGLKEIGDVARNTFGVHVLDIDGKKYCFVLLNTAWSCADNSDTRRLILGKFQLDEISRQFHDLTDDEIMSMTFVMGHHPIECFLGTEQDALFSHMISYTEMSANAYLCGHTHDRNVVNWSNNRHSIHTLMTGFGWPEEPSDRVHDHYYSIYLFNLDLNSMDIYVRKTNDGSGFIPDLSIYTGKGTHEYDKLVRPIRFEEAQGSIILSSATDVPSKTVYASTDFLYYSKLFQYKIHEISLDSGAIIESYKNDLYENFFLNDKEDEEELAETDSLLLEYMNDPEIITLFSTEDLDRIKNVMRQNALRIFDNFQSYIQRLCQKLHEGLVENVEDGQIVRFHFRYLADKTSSTYSTLCSSFSIFDESREQENQPSDIKYGDLLEAAFVSATSKCLIYSINENICTNKLKDKWKDFITIIPKFDGNIYSRRVNKNSIKQYPFITFGVTINDCKYESLLQCMDFYAMDRYIGNLLQRYLNVFMVDIDAFLNWLRSEDNMEARMNGIS